VGVIGCGQVARGKHLPALRQIASATVVAVCDQDVALARRVAERFGVARAVAEAGELLAMRDLDAVAVLTPPETHPALAAAVMEAGRPVYVEIPLALTVGACDALIARATASGLPVMTGLHMRYHRLLRRARDMVRRGAVGRIESIRLVWNDPRHAETLPDWKRQQGGGGGTFMELAVHHLDLVRFLLDDELRDLVALSRHERWEDACAVVAGSTANGVLVSGEFSEQAPHEVTVTLCGDRGILHVDCLRFDGLSWWGRDDRPGAPGVRMRGLFRSLGELPTGLRTLRRGGDYQLSFEGCWRDFLEAVRRGGPPAVTLQDGRRAAAVAAALVASRETGHVTPVTPA
jgi:predicted dehydrogenase